MLIQSRNKALVDSHRIVTGMDHQEEIVTQGFAIVQEVVRIRAGHAGDTADS